jgi:hypothetical protein
MSFHNDPWETPDAYEQDAPERWERLDQREREDEAAQDRLTRDMPARKPMPRPSYDPRVDHPERYMRDGVGQVDV